MNKKAKITLGIGSAIALTAVATGCSNHNESNVVETNAMEPTHTKKASDNQSNKNTTDKKVADKNTTDEKAKENTPTKVSQSTSKEVSSSKEVELSTSKEVNSSKDEVKKENSQSVKTSPTVKTIETKHSIKTVTKTNDNPPKATVSVTKKSGTTLNHLSVSNPSYVGIVDWMNAHGMDSSFGHRAELATQYRIDNYKGTSAQNGRLLGILKGDIHVNTVKVNKHQNDSSQSQTVTKVDHKSNEGSKTQSAQPKPSDTKESTTPEDHEPTAQEPSKTETKPSEPVQNTGTQNGSDKSTTPSTPVVDEHPEQPQPEQPKDVVTTKTTTSTESIPFQTVRQDDPTLEKGKEVVAQEGQDGVKTITYKETYTNGKLTSKDVISSKVTKQPVNKIVKVGTKVNQTAAQILDNVGLFDKSADGNTYTYAIDYQFGTDVTVLLTDGKVSGIYYVANNYMGWDLSLDQCIQYFGQEDGPKEYQYAQTGRANIEKAVRAAANAVYGSGTAQANSLYNEIINSEGYSHHF